MEQKEKDLVYQRGVSLIITSPGGAGELERLVWSFLRKNTHHPFEIVVIDHSAGGALKKIIEKYVARAFFVHLKADPGRPYAASNNYGAEKAFYPNLLFLKHDLLFKEDSLPGAVEKLNDPSSRSGNKFFRLDQVGQASPGGASLLCRRADFEAAGGFSGSGNAGLEELFDRLCESGGGSIKSPSPAGRGQLNELASIFKPFHPARPVVSIHVPKTAGTSFRAVLKSWFKDRLLMYYPDISFQEAAHFSDLLPGQCLHGHFNRGKGFGIEHFVGENPQEKANIITMLRNPYRMIVSLFLYYKYQASEEVIEKSILVDTRPQNFERFFNGFLNSKHYLFSYLLRTAPLTADSIDQYIARYTFIGIQEELEKSVLLLAGLLGKKPLKPLQKNISDYTRDDIPDLEGLAREVFVDEYRLYDRVKEIIDLMQPGP